VTPGVQVVELGENASPDPLATYTGLDYEYMVAMEGDTAYVLGTIGTNNFELHAIDLSTPTSPLMIDKIAFGHHTHHRGMDVDGGMVVFALDDDLWIIDATNPSDLSVASSTPFVCCISDLIVDGPYVYIADYVGLQVFDISNPAAPDSVASIGDLYTTYSLDKEGEWLYLSGEGFGVQVVNVSTPSGPVLHGSLTGAFYHFIAVRGDYAYLAGFYSFGVVDISNPDAPVEVVYQGLPGDALCISEENGIVAVTILDQQVQLFDVTSPTSPMAIGNTGKTYPTRAHEVVAQGGIIVAATEGGQVQIYPGHCTASSIVNTRPAAAATGISVAPNPFNPTTTIRFDVPRPTRISLRIYDVSGKLIKTLAEGRLDARRHQVMWDGTDQAGNTVASGVYFCRLTAGTVTQVRKAVLLK
jgi:hypothetical protein